MKKIILITMLLFSSLATAQWCSGTPNQNLDAARVNFTAACGEAYNDQKGHVCDYKPDGYHCNGNTSTSTSSSFIPTPSSTNQPPLATSNSVDNSGSSSPAQGGLSAPNNLIVRKNSASGPPILKWSPVSGAAGYNIYRDNEYLDTVNRAGGNTEEYTDYSAPGSGKIEYYLTAFDASKQNFSPKSYVYTLAAVSGSNSPDPTNVTDGNNPATGGSTGGGDNTTVNNPATGGSTGGGNNTTVNNPSTGGGAGDSQSNQPTLTNAITGEEYNQPGGSVAAIGVTPTGNDTTTAIDDNSLVVTEQDSETGEIVTNLTILPEGDDGINALFASADDMISGEPSSEVDVQVDPENQTISIPVTDSNGDPVTMTVDLNTGETTYQAPEGYSYVFGVQTPDSVPLDEGGFPGPARGPTNVGISVQGSKTALFTWNNPPDQNSDKVSIRIYNYDDNNNLYFLNLGGRTNRLLVDNLKPNTSYRLNIHRHNSIGSSPWIRIRFRTPPLFNCVGSHGECP